MNIVESLVTDLMRNDDRAAAICYRFKEGGPAPATPTLTLTGQAGQAETIPPIRLSDSRLLDSQHSKEVEFLLVKAVSGGWIFPKGSLEAGETAWQAAEREALEEAGVRGEIQTRRLTTFLLFRPSSSLNPPAFLRVAAFLLQVTETQPPQETKRRPTWYSPEEALRVLHQYGRGRDFPELERVVQAALKTLTYMR